jgi:hypothetical protein|tara:strand:- start:16502 stop:17224 length:723 start_codon:yes stop_codon:yes gene_type:complete
LEKLIYALWRKEGQSREALNDALLGPVTEGLRPLVRALRINVQDDAVEGGTSPRFVVTEPQMDAMVQIWVDTSWSVRREPIEALLNDAAGQVAGWLVSESTPLPNTQHPPVAGERTEGFSQMVFLERPDHLDFDEWRDAWQERHTRVATDTQTNFEYIQNLVVRPVTKGAQPFAAIVEECFPQKALHDRELYFDAVNDPAKLDANYAAMMDSCANFMGPKGGDCIPTSQYDMKVPASRNA